MTRPGPFFIAGTGRSGTSQLNRILGEHPLVWSASLETRFLVDPGGLEELTRALTSAYTPYHADDALRRLRFLVAERLTGRSRDAFKGWDLPGELGEERYWKAVDRLWEQLVWYEFDEAVPYRRREIWRKALSGGRGHRRAMGRYFPDRADLIGILRRFTDNLFTEVANDRGKVTWCEKTPSTLLSTSFVWELFPEAKMVVINRHPISVVVSHRDQPWAPSELSDVISWLEPVYRRWLDQRHRLLLDDRYVEVRLEDLAADWGVERPKLFGRLGLDDAETQSGFRPEAVHHRDQQLSREERRAVVDRLGWAIDALGYDQASGGAGGVGS